MPMEKSEYEKAVSRVIWENPALLTNVTWLVWGGPFVRLTFGEQAGPEEPPMHRATLAIPIADLPALAKLLNDTIAQIEVTTEKDKKAIKEHA